jgi:hypothetical protein
MMRERQQRITPGGQRHEEGDGDQMERPKGRRARTSGEYGRQAEDKERFIDGR